MPEADITTIRLDDTTRDAATRKQEAYGLPSLAALIRFAIKRLPMPKER